MALTRSKKKQVNPKSEYKPEEADSTVAGWPTPAPARRKRNVAPWERNNGVDWQDGLPEGPLLRMFELLHAENTNGATEAMHNAAATCSQWREAFYEVTLGDTAASRPARPPIAIEEMQEKKPPATTATTCAAVCEPSKSETNGFEASSGRRLPAAGYAADYRRSDQLAAQMAALAAAEAAAAAAVAALTAEPVYAALQQVSHEQQQQQQGEHQVQQLRPSRATRSGKLLPPLPDLPRRGHGQHAAAAAGNECLEAAAAGFTAAAFRVAGRDSADAPDSNRLMLGHAAAAAAVEAALAWGDEAAPQQPCQRVRGAGCMGALQQLEHEQQQQHGDDEDEAAASEQRRQRQLKRRRQQGTAAAAATAGTADTDGDGQQEVMQPTTAQNEAAAAAPAGRRRAGQRVRSSGNAAAAAAAAAAASDHNTQPQDGDEDEPSEQQHASQKRLRRRRQQQEQQQGEEQQSQQEQQQRQPADSTEAQQLGLPVDQGPAGSNGRQGSGSARQDSWLGMLNPLHWFRSGSS